MAPSSSALSTFAIVALSLPRLPSLPPELQPAPHYLYIRPHAPKIPDANTSRSLFVSNVPPDANESNLRKLFATHLGGTRIERVEFDAKDILYGHTSNRTARHRDANPSTEVSLAGDSIQQKPGGRKRKRRNHDTDLEAPEARLPQMGEDLNALKSGANAVLVFVDKASADMAMEACRKAASLAQKKGGAKIEWDSGAQITGLERYRRIHKAKYPDSRELLRSVTAYLTAFEEKESARLRARERARTVPDADGFVTVTRGGRTGPARIEEATEALKKEEGRANKRVSDGFYRFQIREKQKEQARELKRQFAEDVRRVEEKRKRRKLRGLG
ncbi:hypothetical protein NA57DRAFT_54638 [Rhizodiscina lignyota]|uniref:RRM domain-containing protein n=1 Tax=Rhizodiscina lignyota TaxID=1504668 RepID=A0A9P4IJV0_9PEZI|nr:hypothetical protein NA57DRAFT_54638 [Rhizodiscina lignyota]